MGKYFLNKETQKIELHFDKSEYMELSYDQKREIKSAFLWSRTASAWVSRSTNNHWRAIQVADNLGLKNEGAKGERLSYAEELERKAERAEARAERYETYSDNAEKRAKSLQSDLESYRGDIAFFTQPIIAGHSGSRAFANYRERLYRRYEKGFEEYEKGEYYKERAAVARGTASMGQLQDRVYLHNRIKEQNKIIKQLQGSIATVENNIYQIQQGKELKSYSGDLLTIEGQEKRVEELLERYDYEYGKLEFFEKALGNLGGIQFSQSNIKPGYIVKMERWGRCDILSAGPANVTFKILDGGAAGGVLTEPYAAINEIVHEKEKKEAINNPFTVGDIVCKERPADSSIYKAYQVIKVTETGVKIRQIAVKNGEPVPDKFIGEPMQKKITKSKYSDFVGIYDDDWQLNKYTQKIQKSEIEMTMTM